MHSKEFSGNQGKHQNFHPSILPYEFGLIFMGMKQKKKIFFFEKKIQNGRLKKSSFFKIANSQKFLRWVLGLVGLNDVKGIDVAQRIWPWSCPTKAQKQPKNAFSVPMKISPNLYGRMDGSKFWCFPWFPENSLLCVILRYTVYMYNTV